MTDKGLVALLSALKRTRPRTVYLQLFDNLIGNVGMKSLANALTREPFVQEKWHLDLTGNTEISDEGIIALLEALAKGGGLKLSTLTLSRCGVTNAGVKALVRAIKNGACPTLSSLGLSCEGIGEPPIELLVDALIEGACPGLHFLDFSKASISRSFEQDMRTKLKANRRGKAAIFLPRAAQMH